MAMEFPREAKYFLDWSPSCGLSYHAFLAQKRFEPVQELLVPESLLPRLASLELLAKHGYVADDEHPRDGAYHLKWDVSEILHAVDIGAGDLATALRWGLVRLTVGLPQINDTVEREPDEAPPIWPYEQFALARSEYQRGLFADALAAANRAISGDQQNSGFPSEFRFHYLVGRLHLGAWCGEHANSSAKIVAPRKAESAFLDAARCLKDLGRDENASSRGLMLLWAGRSAYVNGRIERAVSYASEAIDLVAPEQNGLAAAAHYQLAKALYTRKGIGDQKAAAESLHQALTLDRRLAVEAAADPEFATRPDVLVMALESASGALREKLRKIGTDLTERLAKAKRYSYDGIALTGLLKEEYAVLARAQEDVAKLSESGGLLDLDAANQIADQAKQQCDGLFSLFRSRYAADRWHKWENLIVTRAAKEAETHLKSCREKFAAADIVYRNNGGYDRSGGSEKLLFAIVFLVLSFYMFYASIRWQSQTLPVALLFLIGAGWLTLLFARKKLGLVQGLEAMRSAKYALAVAEIDAKRKETTAAQIWVTYQKSIDTLNRTAAPF